MHFYSRGFVWRLYAFGKENLGRNRINEDIAHSGIHLSVILFVYKTFDGGLKNKQPYGKISPATNVKCT